MPLRIYKRGHHYWVKGRVEYNGRPIAGPYRQSTRATTEAGARDWINQEAELQIRMHVVGEESAMRFADAVDLYHPSAKTAKQLLPILNEIGDMPLGAITGALLKSLGRKLKPKACTDTCQRTQRGGTGSSLSWSCGRASIRLPQPRLGVGQTPIYPCAFMPTQRQMRLMLEPVFVQNMYRWTTINHLKN
jgi:hypothetical protein